MTPAIDVEVLRRFSEAVLRKVGIADERARLTSDSLVQADLWGHQSHGVMRLPWYVARTKVGGIDVAAEPATVTDAGAIAVIDGRNGVGQVTAATAMHDAVKRAKAHGIGAVAVRNSNHFGTAMYFARLAAHAGCVGFVSTNSSPAMAPWGGREKLLGANPWSWAMPAGKHPPLMLDIGNTGVARGKIHVAGKKGQTIPLGWALTPDGKPTTDPAEALKGLILPIGGHKGAGIAMAMDVLSGVLSVSQHGAGVKHPLQAEFPGGTGHFMMALNIAAFRPLKDFEQEMETYIAELKSVPRAEGFDEVLYPGEPEARNDARNRREGVQLPADTLADLRKLGRETGLADLLPSDEALKAS